MMTKYVTGEIMRHLGAKIGLVTTSVVMALRADFADYWEAEVTDVTNNNSKPTIEHCKLSSEHCPKAPDAPRPYIGAQPLPSDETLEAHCFPHVQAVHCPLHCSLCQATAMATAYGFELLGDMSATGTTDPCAKMLDKIEKTAVKTASTGTSSTGKKTEETEIYYTNGNWQTGKGCFHTDPRCWALTKATTGVATGNRAEAKKKGLTLCRMCPVKSIEHMPVLDEVVASIDSDSSDCLTDSYMFSITANCDIHAAILASCDTAQEAALFKQLELVYQPELTTLPECLTDAHTGKTGYFWTVAEVPELRHLIKTGECTGESANFGNWCLWTDCLSALNHWLMRHKFGTEQCSRGRTLRGTAWLASSWTAPSWSVT